MVALSFQIEDPKLMGEVREFLDWTLDHQADDGWIGPEPFVPNATIPRLVWPRYLVLFGLAVRVHIVPLISSHHPLAICRGRSYPVREDY